MRIFQFLSVMGLAFLLWHCGASKNKSNTHVLYDVLTQQPDGGGNLHFYEILTQDKEIHMLLNDPNLEHKVKPDDVKYANFIVFNLGGQNTPGWLLKIVNARETEDSIILSIEEVAPKKSDYHYLPDELVYPYCVVRVNSKKNIIIE